MTSDFKDHFSQSAAGYAAFRPSHPPQVIAYAASLVAHRSVAWDCGTGNGQAAVGLAAHFPRVIATDASASQIAQAPAHAGVEYRVVRAESSGLDDQSVDLVTVAQALHWFDRDAFFREVRRVCVPGGAIAVWAYGDATIDNAAVQQLLHHLSSGTLGAYWPPERRLVDDGYRSIAFPFREVTTPLFTLEAWWTLPELLGYLRSWSSVAAYRRDRDRRRDGSGRGVLRSLGRRRGAPARSLARLGSRRVRVRRDQDLLVRFDVPDQQALRFISHVPRM